MIEHARDIQMQIAKIIEKYYKIDILSHTRHRPVVDMRMIAYKILKEEGINNYTISQVFNKNHATITYAFKMFPELYKYNTEFRTNFKKIKASLNIKKEVSNNCMKCVELHHDYRQEINVLTEQIDNLKTQIKTYQNNPIFDTIKRIPTDEIQPIQRKIQAHLNGIGSKVFTAV